MLKISTISTCFKQCQTTILVRLKVLISEEMAFNFCFGDSAFFPKFSEVSIE